MLGTFVPTRKRSNSCAKVFLTADHLAAKKQKVHHNQHAEALLPVNDSSIAELFAQPYMAQLAALENVNGASGGVAGVPQAGQPGTYGELLPMPEDDFLAGLPDDLDNMSVCTSDTARDEDGEDGEECTSAPAGEQLDLYWEDATSSLASLDDKKAIDLNGLLWSEVGFASSAAEEYDLPAAHNAITTYHDSSATPPYSPDIYRTPSPASHWTAEQLRAVEQVAVTGHVDFSFLPDGSINLKPSQWPTAEQDSFLTKASHTFGPDTYPTEREFFEGPLRMCAESAGSHRSAEDAVTPTVLFPPDCSPLDADITCSEDFDLCCSPLTNDCSSPATNCPSPATDSPPLTATCSPPVTICWPPAISSQSHFNELLDVFLTEAPTPKAASEEVTDSEFIDLCDELDGLFEDGTYQINGRAVTRLSSSEHAKTRPYDLPVVADDIAKQPLHGETNLDWAFVIPNRNSKDLNKYLPEKTWTNGGKTKVKPGPLTDAMVLQNIGFGAHKLPQEEVPGYLQLDAEDRAMLRFSMRVYTRRGVKSSKKAYPTAYIILTLKKPIRRLRHARRAA